MRDRESSVPAVQVRHICEVHAVVEVAVERLIRPAEVTR